MPRPRSTHPAVTALCAALVALVALAALPGTSAARAVLVESFGSVGCPACSAVRNALDELSVEFGDNLLAVEYQTGLPLGSPETAQRAAYYGVSEPVSLFDGADPYAAAGSAVDSCRARIQVHAAVASPIELDALAEFSELAHSGTLSVEIRIGPGGVSDPEQVSVRALLLEDDIPHCCGPAGRTTWDRVVRHVLEARPLQATTPDQRQFELWGTSLDPGWVIENLRAIIFLQRDTDQSVLGASLAANGTGLKPLPLTGLDESRVNLLPCQPNPFRGGETLILFTLPEPGPAKLRILNARGRVVRVLTDGLRPQGVHPVPWDGRDYTGRWMAAGVYVYVLETNAGVLSRKLTLLR